MKKKFVTFVLVLSLAIGLLSSQVSAPDLSAPATTQAVAQTNQDIYLVRCAMGK